jgi:hypothetical protein
MQPFYSFTKAKKEMESLRTKTQAYRRKDKPQCGQSWEIQHVGLGAHSFILWT